jgi:ribose-phosphate pyrophosphokinase
MELLIMIDSFRRASAGRITAVIPYFGYARQDRKEAGRVPITAKLVANLISEAGADRVLTMDLHSPQIQGFFDIPVDHLYAAPVFHRYFQKLGFRREDIVVVSPDVGSIKRALMHATQLGAPLAVVDKRRQGDSVMQANLIGGPLTGKVALLFDDMISTGKSIAGAAEVVHQAGAKEIYLAATHGVLCKGAAETLERCPAKKVLITDTIPLTPDRRTPNMEVLSVARLLAEAIKRIHLNESVSHLFEVAFA